MKGLGKILSLIVWIVILLVAFLLLFSAFSPSIVQPVKHSVLSLAGFVFPLLVVINLLLLLLLLLFRRFKVALVPLAGLAMCYSQLSTYFPLNLTSTKQSEGSIKQKDVDKALSDYPYRSGKTADGKKPLPYMAVYSKLPVLKTERIAMESSNNGAMAYQLKWGLDTLLLINCHLESNKLTSEDKEMYEQMIEKHETEQVKAGLRVLVKKLAEASAIRAPQADSIANYLKRHPYKYVMVCGDFNDIPISYTHHTLTRTLNDAFVESGRGLGISYHKNKFLFRIDNILVSAGLKTSNCTVDSSIDASDHYPIWAYVEKN